MEKFTNDPTTDTLHAEVIRKHMQALGSIKSEKKAKSSRENGKKGGRPKAITPLNSEGE